MFIDYEMDGNHYENFVGALAWIRDSSTWIKRPARHCAACWISLFELIGEESVNDLLDIYLKEKEAAEGWFLFHKAFRQIDPCRELAVKPIKKANKQTELRQISHAIDSIFWHLVHLDSYGAAVLWHVFKKAHKYEMVTNTQ